MRSVGKQTSMSKIAILGFGVVGSGVAELLAQNTQKITHSANDEISLKYLLDIRSFPDSPFADKFVTDFAQIENDPEVQVVVEAMGGVGAAYDFTKRALLAGKNVVTSNKELVAAHGHELLTIAKDKNVNYLFEASVGGGIPLIRPISQCLAANEITEICGIINGTTNYMLTEMGTKGLPFSVALQEAQALGYAEADPTADVEGHDACRKICILASLCFGQHVYPADVPAEGITKVTPADLAYAQAAGYKIKLLGRARRTEDGKVAAYVAPHLISTSNILSHVDGVFNGIQVRGNATGNVMFCGPGAGKFPTASAVMADVIDCVKHLNTRKFLAWGAGGSELSADPLALETRWYIRTPIGGEKAFDQVETLPGGADSAEIAFLIGPISQKALAPKLEAAGALSAFRILE